MKNATKVRYAHFLMMLVGLVGSFSLLHAQAPNAASGMKSGATSKQAFDPRNLSGFWAGDTIPGLQNRASVDQKLPEPPLTDWAKQNLLYKAISHDSLSGKELPGSPCKNGHRGPCFSEDLYGVRVNDPDGEYPAKDCEPLSSPAMYDYPYLGVINLVPAPEGDHIVALYSYHREFRTFWLNRDHPKKPDPTYEGDSTAHWEGDELVVDTIGYNGKTMISQDIGHSKSDAFNLVERFRLLDRDHLVIDMTYSDPKAWGDKSWPGFKKYYKRTPPEDFDEFICSPREYMTYDKLVTDPLKKDAPAK